MSRWIVILIFGILLLLSCRPSPSPASPEPPLPPKPDTVSLLFVGDIMCHRPQAYSALKDSVFDFSGWFQYVTPTIDQADIAFGNLETTLSSTGPYSGYPKFKSPDELAHGIEGAGFDVIVTANNHSNDTRAKGLTHTLDVLRSLGLYHTGTFMDSLDKALHYPLLIKQAGISIALLNYTYDTNGVPTTPPTLVNEIDTIQMKIDIEKAKTMNADLIIAFMHWGTEYRTKWNYRQRRLTRLMLREGVDHIIGAHPHVVEPIDIFGEEDQPNLVAYSLGNFISNQNKDLTDGGIMLKMNVVKTEDNTHLESWNYIPIWRYIRPGSPNTYEVIPTNEFLTDTAHFHSIGAFNQMVKYHNYINDFFKD